MSVFAGDVEPNDVIGEAEGGGVLSWPDHPRYGLQLQVQSTQPGDFVTVVDSTDPADWVKLTTPSALTVIVRPYIDDFDINAQMQRDGVNGVIASATFTPHGRFAGAAVTLVATSGSQTATVRSIDHEDPYANLLGLYADMLDVRLGNPDDDGLNADIGRAEFIMDQFDQLYEGNGLNPDTSAIAQAINNVVGVGPSSAFLPQIIALAQELSAVAAAWNEVVYYTIDAEGAFIEIDPFFDLGPLSDGFSWNVVPDASGFGYIEVTGTLLASSSLGNEAFAVDTFGSDIAFGTGVLPASTTLVVNDDTTLSVTNASVGSNKLISLNAAVLTNAHQLRFDGSAVTSAAFDITGGAGADSILGGARDDLLSGGAGADVLAGGLGGDTYRVDNAGDVTTEAVNAGTDTVIATRSWAVASNVERVILSGTGNFNVAGNGLANTLKGNSGDNWLNGSFGKDTLTGGGGRDSFIFNRALGPNNIDTITDYDVVRDVIRIDNAVFAGIGPAGALAVGMFNTGASATQADDRIIYDPATGKLFFDIDGLGGSAQIHFATLSTKPTGMSAGEFIII